VLAEFDLNLNDYIKKIRCHYLRKFLRKFLNTGKKIVIASPQKHKHINFVIDLISATNYLGNSHLGRWKSVFIYSSSKKKYGKYSLINFFPFLLIILYELLNMHQKLAIKKRHTY